MHRQLFSLFKFRKSTLLIIVAVVFLLSVFATAVYNTQKVGAVTTAASKSTDIDWQVQSWWYYNAMTQCMTDNGAWNISSASDVNSGNWFDGIFTNNAETSGWYMQDNLSMGDDGQINCNENDNELAKSALNFWGLSGTEVMCGAGILVRDNGTNCAGGNGDFNWAKAGDDSQGSQFAKYIRTQVFGGDTPSLTSAMKYVLYRQTLLNACTAPSAVAYDKDPGGSNVYKIADVDSSTTPASTVIHYYIGNQPASFSAWVSTNPDSHKTCKELANAIDSTGSGSLAFAAAAASSGGSTIVPSVNQNGDSDTGTSCSVEGIGWILCPIANAVAGMTDALFDGVTAFMKVTPLNLSPKDNPLYTAWSVMRTFANVAFVIVFLIIIFSQLTSAGVSNYGVKKLLPRLVVGAILVNVSFYLCAIAVDVSNILGVGIQQLFDSIQSTSSGASDAGDTVYTWSSITSVVLSGAGVVGAGFVISAATAGGLWGAIAGLLPLLVGALFALIIAFLVLLARQALIIMAIVVSPLAFVAFLLPNTEGLFKKWKDLFVSLLVLFPMLSLVFGASGLAAVILRASAQGMKEQSTFIAFFLYIGSFAIQAIPFFITPLLIKLSSGVLGRFAGIVNNPNKGPIDRLRKGGERIAKNTQDRGSTRKLKGIGLGSKGPLAFGARRRERIKTTTAGLENSAKQAANQYTTTEIAKKDANGNPSRLASRMAAGNKENANLLALRAQASLLNEENEEAKTAIGQANLSGNDRHKLATTGSVDLGNGTKLEGEALQRAAIQEQFRAGSYGQQVELLNASGKDASGNDGALAKFAQTISSSAAANGLGSKDPALAGKRLDEIAQGEFKYDAAVTAAIREGKYTAEAFASMNNDARSNAITIAQKAESAGDPSLMAALRSAAEGVQNSAEIKGRVSGNIEALTQINGLAPTATAAPASGPAQQAPAAPTNNRSSGSGPGGFVLPEDPGFNPRDNSGGPRS